MSSIPSDLGTTFFDEVSLLRLLLADSTTYRSIVDASDANEALETIHDTRAIDEIHPLPRAVVRISDDMYEKSSRNNFVNQHRLMLFFEFVAPEELWAGQMITEQAHWFRQTYKAIIGEMLQLEGLGNPAGDVTHLTIRQIRQAIDPGPERPEKRKVRLAKEGHSPPVVWTVAYAVECGS